MKEADIPYTVSSEGKIGFLETEVVLQSFLEAMAQNGIEIEQIENKKIGAGDVTRNCLQRRIQMRLLLFECKKIFYSKKFLYLVVLLVLGIAFLFIRNVTFQSYVQKEEIQNVDKQIKKGQANARHHRISLENDPKNKEQQHLQQINENMQSILYDLSARLTSKDWQTKLMLQNEIYAASLDYKEASGDLPISNKEIEYGIAMNDKLLKEGIPPEIKKTYSIAFPNFMGQVVDLFIHFGAFILLIVIIGETLSGEYENYSINLLFSQPLRKSRIIRNAENFGSAVLLYAVLMIVVLLATAIIGLIFGDAGSFQYPVLIEKNGGIEFLTISNYMLKGLLIVSASIILVIPLYLLYSLLFKQTLSTLAILLMTFVAGYGLSAFVSWGAFSWFNPFLNLSTRPDDLIPEWPRVVPSDTSHYSGVRLVRSRIAEGQDSQNIFMT